MTSEPLDDPTPLNFGNVGCPAMTRRGRGQWGPCPAEPEFAGYLDVTKHVPQARRGTYRAFPCRAHRDLVRDSQPMTDGDWAELAHRREQAERAMAGQPYEKVQPIRR